LFRSSDIGFGYPNIEELLGFANYTPQKIIQTLILLLLCVYFFFFPERLLLLKIRGLTSYILAIAIVGSVVFSNHLLLSARFLLSFVVIFIPLVLFSSRYGVSSLITLVSYFLFFLLIACFIYVAIFPYYGIMAGNHDGAFRGLFLHKNAFGFFCVVTSLFCFFSYHADSVKGRKRYLVMFILCSIAVVKSLSTTSIVLFGFSTIAFYFFYGIYLVREPHLRIVFYYFFLFFTLTFLILFSVYFEEITYALGKDPTLTGRTELWETLIHIASEKPIFGHGFGLFFRPEIMYEYSSEFGWEAKSTHNSFIDLYLGIGIVGLCSFLWLLITKIGTYPLFSRFSHFRLLSVTGIILVFCFGFSESGAFLGVGLIWVLLVVFIYGASE
jgi:O-antigen ligase